jgi:hypothetical protein
MTTPQLMDVIEEAIRESRASIRTVQLAVVYIANPDGEVTVQPVTSQVIPGVGYIDGAKNGNVVPHPNGRDTILHYAPLKVPVAWPSGGGKVITWPMRPGDIVLLVALTLNESNWLSTGVVRSAPLSSASGMHGATFVAIPLGIRPRPQPRLPTASSPTDMVLGQEDGSVQVLIGSTDVKLGGAEAVSPVAKGDVADANWASGTAWAATVRGALAAFGITVPALGATPYPINSEQAVKAKVV